MIPAAFSTITRALSLKLADNFCADRTARAARAKMHENTSSDPARGVGGKESVAHCPARGQRIGMQALLAKAHP